MCSLATFPPPPKEGLITICERNADLVVSDNTDNDIIKSLCYPEVILALKESKVNAGETARSAFLEHGDTPWKRLRCAWYEHGVTGVLEELAANQELKGRSSGGVKYLSYVAGSVLGIVRGAMSLHGTYFPHLALSNEALIAEFSPISNWKKSPVTYFAWHPHTLKCAVALSDDSIKVYTAKRDIVPVLKHKMQKGVAALAWKPLSASLLAVGCQSCVLLWNVDPMSLATRPSSSAVQVLSRAGHSPVTSLAWCPQGGVLVTGSPTDSAIMVWDVATEVCVPLRRAGGGGVALLSWSPDGSKLLAASPTSMFRVWETQTWTSEKWSKLAGRCKTGCWSPSGNILLFATVEEPMIYSLTFSPAPTTSPSAGASSCIGGSQVAVTTVDVTQCEIHREDGTSVVVGGRIQNMAWDPTGERLAVQFKDGSPELIALFQTRLEPILELLPCGFIRGRAGEIPTLISFQPKFEEGALLTTVWSSGRVSYTPLYFVHRNAVGSQQIYQHQMPQARVQRNNVPSKGQANVSDQNASMLFSRIEDNSF